MLAREDMVLQYTCMSVQHVFFAGTFCELPIDDCEMVTCYNSGTCIDMDNDYTCQCTTSYTGKNCEILLDACWNVTCEHSGTCHSLSDTNFICDCPYGYEGKCILSCVVRSYYPVYSR